MSVNLKEIVGELSDPSCRALMGAKMVRYATASDLWDAHMAPIMKEVGVTDRNELLLDGKTNGDEVSRSLDEMGFWGFAQPNENTIHVWWKRSVPNVQIFALVAHELEHLVYQNWKRQRVGGIRLEERRCDLTGAIAARAYELIQGTKIDKPKRTSKPTRPTKSQTVEVATGRKEQSENSGSWRIGNEAAARVKRMSRMPV